MNRSNRHRISLALFLLLVLTACSRATGGATASATAAPPAPPVIRTDSAAIERARADSVRRPYTAADVAFMTSMIAHHTQAITIARWAPDHGASAAIQRLAERVINAQQDEILLMQQWLADRRQSSHADHAAHPMPGMLTEAQLRQLNAARGSEFDRLFLTLMIQHHQGAIAMVRDLFGTYGAAQDQTVFKVASDIRVDQATEIARMEQMLNNFPTNQGNQP